MADEIDLANEMMAREINHALRKMQQNAGNSQEGAEFCSECGDKMIVERKKMGFKICKPCAEVSERRKSQYAD